MPGMGHPVRQRQSLSEKHPGVPGQAAADARGAADAQAAWLRAHMGPHFGRRLLGVVRNIQRFMGAHDGRPDHQFPRLAGSHLSEVCLTTSRPACPGLPDHPS